jgi:hypothetical protein
LRQAAALALVLVAAAALGGCRDEEQGRMLSFDKGEYGGPPVPAPPDAAAQGWRERAEKMKF